MSLLEKVKNFFYEEDDDYVEKEPIKRHQPKEKIKITELKEEKIRKPEPKEENISERELFKAERTFNFPMDIDDEDFVEAKEEKKVEIKEEKTLVNTKPYTTRVNNEKINSYTGIRSYAKYEEKKEEPIIEKKFKPTPVISPIYGVLDKNYKKEDLLIDQAKKEKEVKKVDYDSIRKKAYRDIYEDDTDEESNIFFNLDTEQKKEADEDDDDVKIVYNDVDTKEDENITFGEKIDKYEQELAKEDMNNYEEQDEDSQILSQTKEQDLFNLIDNMYNSEEDEEEDE